MVKNVTIIKLGGSIITDKSRPYTPNEKALKMLALEIKKAGVPVLIVHGQGSFAHTSAKKYGGKKGYKSTLGVAKVFLDAMEMNSVVMKVLYKAKIPAVSFRPNSLFLSTNGKLSKNNIQPVYEALQQGIVPVLYGDVIMDTRLKTTIFSGEVSARYVALLLAKHHVNVKKIIQVGRTDGVLASDGKSLSRISAQSFEGIKKYIFTTKTTDVTGGMLHKVEEAVQLARLGIQTIILNGTRKNELNKALANKSSKFTTTVQ